MTRTCGECKVCCTLLGVPEINKPERTRCDRLCNTGCSDYENRPVLCRGYGCAWLFGLGPARWRPDRLGIVFDNALDPELVGMANGERWVVARETRPGSFGERRAVEALLEVTDRCVTFMAYWNPGNGRPGLVAPKGFKPLPVVAQ